MKNKDNTETKEEFNLKDLNSIYEIRLLDEYGKQGEVIGVIKGFKGSEKYKNTIKTYIYGKVPIFIKTNLNQRQFNKLCKRYLQLSNAERIRLKTFI